MGRACAGTHTNKTLPVPGRDPYDVLEEWPDDDAELAVVEAQSRSTMVAVIAIVMLLIAVIAIVVGFLVLSSFIDSKSDEGDVARFPTASTSRADVSA